MVTEIRWWIAKAAVKRRSGGGNLEEEVRGEGWPEDYDQVDLPRMTKRITTPTGRVAGVHPHEPRRPLHPALR
jgi:hypothetical protein